MDKDMPGAAWRKSTHSNGQGDCVETVSVNGSIFVRDTKQGGRGPVLTWDDASWRVFTASLKQ